MGKRIFLVLAAIIPLGASFAFFGDDTGPDSNPYEKYMNFGQPAQQKTNDPLALEQPEPCLPDPNANQPWFMNFKKEPKQKVGQKSGGQPKEQQKATVARDNETISLEEYLKSAVCIGFIGLAGYLAWRWFRQKAN